VVNSQRKPKTLAPHPHQNKNFEKQRDYVRSQITTTFKRKIKNKKTVSSPVVVDICEYE